MFLIPLVPLAATAPGVPAEPIWVHLARGVGTIAFSAIVIWLVVRIIMKD
jgi:hypothetical protein